MLRSFYPNNPIIILTFDCYDALHEREANRFVDSTHFAVCKNIRIYRNRTFSGLAKRGHSSIDWFYGFKLHIIINDRIVAIRITKGNVDDRKAFEEMVIKKGLKGKVYAGIHF